MLIFAYLRERQALGIMAVLGGLARAVDVTLIRQEGEAQRRKANIHTIAGMLWTAVGAWLLGTRG